MATYEYQHYYCPNCDIKTTKKTCDCGTKTKGQGMVCMRFRVAINGKIVHKRTKWYNAKRDAKDEYIETIRHAMSVTSALPDNGSTYRFEVLLEKHIATNALGTKESTQYQKRKAFDKYILPYFQGKDVRRITKPMLIEWQTRLFSYTYCRGKKGTPIRISNKHARTVRGFLNTFFEWLNSAYEIPNLLKEIEIPKNTEVKKEREFLEYWEYQKLDNVSRDDILWNTFFAFLFHTGCRPGECQAFSETDYSNGEITIRKTITRNKNGRHAIIVPVKNLKIYSKPIDTFLIEKLDRYLAWKRQNGISGKFLFGGDDFISRQKCERMLSYYIAKAEITKHITLHSFRHSYVAMLINLDCSTKTVAEMIGDTEEVVMKTYSHLYKDKKRSTVDKLNAFLNTSSGT